MWLVDLLNLIRNFIRAIFTIQVVQLIIFLIGILVLSPLESCRVDRMPLDERFQFTIQRQSGTEEEAAAILSAETYVPPISPPADCTDCGPCKPAGELIHGYEQFVADSKANPLHGTSCYITYTATVEHRGSYRVEAQDTTYEDVEVVVMTFEARYVAALMYHGGGNLTRTVVLDAEGNVIDSSGECEPRVYWMM